MLPSGQSMFWSSRKSVLEKENEKIALKTHTNIHTQILSISRALLKSSKNLCEGHLPGPFGHLSSHVQNESELSGSLVAQQMTLSCVK